MIDTTLRNKARRILGLSKPSPSPFSLPLEKRRLTALEAIKEGAFRGAKTVALEWGLKDSARCEDSASYALEAVFTRFLCHKVPTMGEGGKVLRFQRGENKGKPRYTLQKNDGSFRLWASFPTMRGAYAYGWTIGLRHQLKVLERMEAKQEEALNDSIENRRVELSSTLEGIVKQSDLNLNPKEEKYLILKLEGSTHSKALEILFPKMQRSSRYRIGNKIQRTLKSKLGQAEQEF